MNNPNEREGNTPIESKKNGKIFFFDISRIDVLKAIQHVITQFPDAEGKFSISKDENGDGFYLNVPDDCPAEWIFKAGMEYAYILQRNNPFKDLT